MPPPLPQPLSMPPFWSAGAMEASSSRALALGTAFMLLLIALPSAFLYLTSSAATRATLLASSPSLPGARPQGRKGRASATFARRDAPHLLIKLSSFLHQALPSQFKQSPIKKAVGKGDLYMDPCRGRISSRRGSTGAGAAGHDNCDVFRYLGELVSLEVINLDRNNMSGALQDTALRASSESRGRISRGLCQSYVHA